MQIRGSAGRSVVVVTVSSHHDDLKPRLRARPRGLEDLRVSKRLMERVQLG